MADRYVIEYSIEAVEDLGAIRAFDQATVRSEVIQNLSHEPTRTSRSRIKQMEQPFWCGFRLRVGDF